MSSGLFVVGVDLGQAQDYTAICVVEATATEYRRTVSDLDPEYRVRRELQETYCDRPVSYELRYLERLPLGTFYPQAVERTKEIVHRLPAGE